MNKPKYVLIPVADLTEEMINMSKKDFNVIGDVTSHSLRENDAATSILIKFKDSSTSVFNSYVWYTHTEILTKMTEAEWRD